MIVAFKVEWELNILQIITNEIQERVLLFHTILPFPSQVTLLCQKLNCLLFQILISYSTKYNHRYSIDERINEPTGSISRSFAKFSPSSSWGIFPLLQILQRLQLPKSVLLYHPHVGPKYHQVHSTLCLRAIHGRPQISEKIR